ncbi:MAG: hypothetical protein JNM84_26345 [Planctomycetes bacterium]|nr:hypothetical protein [Planctomycetota bacterium]
MRCLSTLALALFLASTASAADYYLDAGAGNDANPGTAAQPWRTISFALGQPLASGDVLRLRGTFAAPAESFPLSLLPGVSLTTWDASSTARIDAGASPCVRIIRPGDHTEEIIGNAGSLVVAGAPAVRIEAPNAATRCTSRIVGCRIEGRFEVYVAYGYAGHGVHLVIDDCHLAGDMHLFSDSTGNLMIDNPMSARVSRCTHIGDVLAENPESRFLLQDCEVHGSVRCIETQGGDAGFVEILRNRIFSGSITCDSTQSVYGLMHPRVHDNTVEGGSIIINLSGDDTAGSALRNTVRRGNLYVGAYYLYPVEDNIVDGQLVVSASRRGVSDRISGNTCHSITASVLDYLTITENTVTNGGINIPWSPYYFAILRNRIHGAAGRGIFVGAGSAWSTLAISSIEENIISGGNASPGIAGIHIECNLQRLYILNNTIANWITGVAIPPEFGFDALALENNSIAQCGVAADIHLDRGRASAHFLGNVISLSQVGVRLHRPGSSIPIEAWGNIFAGNSIADITPGSLLPSDDVRGNLAEDGSLLDFHPSNISGDPHFVDAANGDFHLRPTSPCIAPGNNPAGGDIGRFQSGLQPTLEVVELGGNLASFRTRGENGDHVILFIAAYPARPAALTLCDGLLGLDAPTILAVLPGIITFGRWDLIVDVPPNLAFTAVLQSLRVDLNAPTECSMTNTRFFRR